MCLGPAVDYTTIRHLSKIAQAMLSMSGRITMRGLSRWTNRYGSYPTIQRFFYSSINWGKLRWLDTSRHLLEPGEVVLVVGDEVVVTKSGKKTYGLGRIDSSLYGKAVPGLSFLSLSLFVTSTIVLTL